MEESPEQEVSQDIDEEIVNEEAPTNDKKARSPAFAINFYSWATPIVGIVMLLLGLVGGYFIRPLVGAAPAATPTEAASAAAQSSVQTEAPQPTMDPTTRQQLMDYLLPQVKHFKGDANAPVTLLEFSDFQ
jgi:hypothetical protein